MLCERVSLEAAGVAVRGGEVERRQSRGALVHGHVGLPLEQALHHLGVAVLGGQVQRGAALRVWEVGQRESIRSGWG